MSSRSAALAPALGAVLSTLVCLSSLAAPPPRSAAVPSPLTITLGDRSLTVSPITPGGQAVLAGVDRESATFFFNDTHYSDAQSEVGGTATFAIDRGITARSVWIAVDVATGRVAIVTPAGSPYRARPSAAKSASGRAPSIAIDGSSIDLLLVRAGIGAWRLAAGDGAAMDADGLQNQTLTLAAGDFEPLAGTAAPPSELTVHDLLIGIDALRQEYFVMEVQP